MKIVRKTLVVYPEPIPVYDLTSPDYENFVLASGAVVHNCKRARDKSYQAIYPLRGKPLNPIDTKKDKVVNNKEVVGLLAALGMDLNSKTPEKTVKYGKIVILADPDVDGKHINCILLAILWKYTPHLIKGGYVFAAKAPLYKGRHKNQVYFGMTKESVYKKAGTSNLDVTYLKGWGECDEEDLKIVLDPGVRKLTRITVEQAKDSKDFLALMGANPEYRKKLLGLI